MVRYVKCPRCELNYIDGDKQEYCDVCLAEMKGGKLQFADLDEEDYEELDANEELCPVCGVNMMPYGDTMCEACKKEREEYNEEEEVDMDKDEEWKNYLDEDEDDLKVDEEVAEELEEEFGDKDEEDEIYEGGDELDDELDDLDVDGLDDDDEDDEDDDEDDEDDDLF